MLGFPATRIQSWARFGSRSRRCFSVRNNHEPFNVLFLGRDEFSVTVLDQLHSSRDVWNDITIITHPDERVGRGGSKVSISPLKVKAAQLGLETSFIPHGKAAFREWQPPSRFRHDIQPQNSVIITASFGRMIPDHVLHYFSALRRLNVHPSLLPLYRGPAPLQHAIADGRKETGVSILEMREKRFGADVGAIWAQEALSISEDVTYSQLRDVTGIMGGKLLVSVLRDMITGKAAAKPQDDSQATRAPFIKQETATIDFSSWDAHKVERMERAIGHQKPLTTYLPSSKLLHLFQVRSAQQSAHGADLPKPLQALREPGDATFDPTTRAVAIRCANDTFVHVPVLQSQDKRQLPAQEWWKGVWPQWLNNRVMRLGLPNPL